ATGSAARSASVSASSTAIRSPSGRRPGRRCRPTPRRRRRSSSKARLRRSRRGAGTGSTPSLTRKPSVAQQPRGAAGASAANGIRQGEVLAAAAELFAEHGYISTTVRDIADAAGILSGSLYHHFDSKESMVDEILRGFLDALFARYHAIVA